MRISTEIKKTALLNDIALEELPFEQAKTIRKIIHQKYIISPGGTFLWDHLKDRIDIADSEGWWKLCDYVGSKKCFMFFNDYEDNTVLVIKNGKTLRKLLGEMYPFEFYITNVETDYLICFNHHDCLICSGAAKKWAESLIK